LRGLGTYQEPLAAPVLPWSRNGSMETENARLGTPSGQRLWVDSGPDTPRAPGPVGK